jgi:RNA ligase (TIGR02306 family)
MENQNSCCFVAEIKEIKPIEGADKIELAVINGWNCITQKGNYQAGDLVICATTDAVIPQKLAEDLDVTNYLRSGNRVRTIKLKGVYSECLIIPFSYGNNNKLKEGSDVMNILGVFKYEPPAKQIQLASGKKVRYDENPNFHIYYKFPNIKNVPGIFTEEDEVEITRKIHGTNARYGIVKKKKVSLLDRIKIFVSKKFNFLPESWYWSEYEFVVGSHNVEKGSDSQGFYDTNVWYEIADKYKIEEKLWKAVRRESVSVIGQGLILYGEIYGAGIQKNYDYGLKDIKFAGFDVKINGEYEAPTMSKIIIEIILELPYVKVLYYGEWNQFIQDIFVMNNFIPGTKIPEEGIVIKHHTGERSKVAKVINPDYSIYSEKKDVGDSH